MTDKYIAISPTYYGGTYGLGETIDEAKKNCKKNFGNLNCVYVKELPDGIHSTWMDEMGNILWDYPVGLAEEGRPEVILPLPVVYKRGVKFDSPTN